MPISDYRDVLSYYSSFLSPRDTRADYAQGESDGRANKPRSNENTLSSYELDIVNQARADISRFRLQLQLDLHGSQAALTAMRQQRYEEYESELRALGHRHDSRIATLNKESGPGSSLARRQAEALFEAEQSYGDLNRELEREPELHFARRLLSFIPISVYTFLLVAMSFVELFINKGVFRSVLGGVVAGYAGAFIMGLAIVFFSHMLGILLRQWRVRRHPLEIFRTWIGIPLIVIVVLLSLYELSVIREATLPMDDRLDSIGKILGLSHQAALLFLLNAGVFLAGTLLSYFRHDAHPDYERLLQALEKARADNEERQKNHDLLASEVEEDFRRRRANLSARADRVQREIDQDLAKAESLPGREDVEIQKVIAVVTQRILAYQAGNDRSRSAARPPYFGERTVDLVENLIRGDGADGFARRARAAAYAEE